jgi:hypothetical protein
MKKHLQVFLDELEAITDEPAPAGEPPPQPDSEPIADALSKSERDALKASDFAVPGKRALPMHDEKHAKLAWSQVAKTKDLTDDERKSAYRRILARLKKLGVNVARYKSKGKAIADSAEPVVAISWPEGLPLDDLRSCLRHELKEHFPKYYLLDVYPGLGLVTASKSSYYDSDGNWSYDNRTYTIPYEITDTDDGDGDVDTCNIKFGEPKVSIMTPKVIEDEITHAMSGQAQILTDEADLKAGKPFSFRLPSARANVVNGNNRMYPRKLLLDAIEAAKPRMRRGEMFSYMKHPPKVKLADGSTQFAPDMERRVAKIVNWFMDDGGQTWVDREIIPTPMGQVLRANIESKAAVATSIRAFGEVATNNYGGRSVQIARSLILDGDDFVENPALTSTWAQAQMLTDEQVTSLIDTAPIPAELKAPTKPAPAGEPPAAPIADAATNNSPDQPARQVNNSETEADMLRFRKNEKGELILDENGTFNAKGEPLTDAQAPPAPAGQAEGGTQSTQAGAPAQAAAAGQVMLDEETANDIKLWREERKQQTARNTVKAFLDDVFGGNEATSPVDSARKVAKMDLSRFTNDDVADIRAICDDAVPEEVEGLLARAIALKDKEIIRRKKTGMGFKTSAAGSTSGVVITDEAAPWKASVDKICAAMSDQHRRVYGKPISDSLKKYNQPFIDQLLAGSLENDRRNHGATSPLLDSVEAFEDDSTNLSVLLQQPTITPATAAIIQQMFWQMEWLPMCGGIGPEGFNGGPGSDAGIGENLRIQVEVRGAGRGNTRTRESQPVKMVTTKTRWLNYAPVWRKLGFKLTPEARVQLQRGPGRYDPMGRQMFNVAQQFAEEIDLALAHEHYDASDEFNAAKVVGETYQAADVLTGGNIPFAGTDSAYGASVAAAIIMLETITINGNPYPQPIVPPRMLRVIQEDGKIQPATNKTTNPITVVSSDGVTLIQGYLDAETREIMDDPLDESGLPADFAVDYENGTFLFNNANGANRQVTAAKLPTISYSYATNITWFDLGPSNTADDVAIFYDSLLGELDYVGSVMGSHPRYKPPTDAIFTLIGSNYVTRARQSSNLYHVPGGDAKLTGGKPARFGRRGDEGGVDFCKLNTPLRSGHSRVLLKAGDAVKYGVQYPWQVSQPINDLVGRVVNGRVINEPTGDIYHIGMQNSVICTPVGFDEINGEIVQYNHPLHTVKFVRTGAR